MKRLCQSCQQAFDLTALAPLEDGSLCCGPCCERMARAFRPVAVPILEEPSPPSPLLDRAGWTDLAIGSGLAVFFLFVPILGCVSLTLLTLFHEFGHAVVHWSFGYPAVPAFDLTGGGGVTLAIDRSAALVVLFYVAGAGLAGWLWRTERRGPGTALGACGLVHVVLGLTRWHQTLVAYMGHGTELALGGVFLYRALTGRAIVNRLERPLYAAIGLYAVLHNVEFAIRLLGDRAFVARYLQGKHGTPHDFVQVAAHLGVALGTVAVLHLAACALTLAASALAARRAGPERQARSKRSSSIVFRST